MQGVKRKRRCEIQCLQHLFLLEAQKTSPKYDISLTFCPKYQRQPCPPEHSYPVFNDDGLYYTSAFVLGLDKKEIARNLQRQMLDHNKLIKQSQEKYNQIVFPKPNSKHTTCSVCKEQYTNYYHHIFSDEHSEKIQMTPYNQYIKGLCDLFVDLWDGCAQKADQVDQESREAKRALHEKNQREELILEGIVEEEEINENPSQIFNGQMKQHHYERQVNMVRPSHHEPENKPSKLYEDRQSRKKNIKFSHYFEETPSKKYFNDSREAITVGSKKASKNLLAPSYKSQKQQPQLKKRIEVRETDPFTIQYNARTAKKKQKKSYYLLKKRQRQLKEQQKKRSIERMRREQKLDIGKPFIDLSGVSDKGSQNGDSHSPSSQMNSSIEENQFRVNNSSSDNQRPHKLTDLAIKKTVSKDLGLFEEVQKRPVSLNATLQLEFPNKFPRRVDGEEPKRDTRNTQIMYSHTTNGNLNFNYNSRESEYASRPKSSSEVMSPAKPRLEETSFRRHHLTEKVYKQTKNPQTQQRQFDQGLCQQYESSYKKYKEKEKQLRSDQQPMKDQLFETVSGRGQPVQSDQELAYLSTLDKETALRKQKYLAAQYSSKSIPDRPPDYSPAPNISHGYNNEYIHYSKQENSFEKSSNFEYGTKNRNIQSRMDYPNKSNLNPQGYYPRDTNPNNWQNAYYNVGPTVSGQGPRENFTNNDPIHKDTNMPHPPQGPQQYSGYSLGPYGNYPTSAYVPPMARQQFLAGNSGSLPAQGPANTNININFPAVYMPAFNGMHPYSGQPRYADSQNLGLPGMGNGAGLSITREQSPSFNGPHDLQAEQQRSHLMKPSQRFQEGSASKLLPYAEYQEFKKKEGERSNNPRR